MSDVAGIIAELVLAGNSADLIGRVAAALAARPTEIVAVKDEAAERRREKDRERKALRKSAEHIPSHSAENPATLPQNSAETASRVRPRVEDKTLLTEIEPQEVKREKKDARPNDLADFRDELKADLDPERLDALIKLRRTKRGQLTGHAARLFRRDAAACHLSIAQATDTCISRNWLTVKPEWLSDRNARGSPGKPLTGLAALTEQFRQELQNDGYGNESEEGGDHRNDARLPLLAGPHK